MGDVLSEIGGIGASVSVVMAICSIVFILFYVVSLTQMIQRKNAHQVRKAYIRKNKIRLTRILESKIDYCQRLPLEKQDKSLLNKYEKDLE